MKKAIIVGASSGIGEALAKEMSSKGWELGLTARREEKLLQLKAELANPAHVCRMDVAQTEEARAALQELIEQMGGVEVIILNAGIGDLQQKWPIEQKIIQVNVVGFVALARLAFDYFTAQGGGQIVGISSVSATRGARLGTVYASTKAFISSYMEGLRHKSIKKKLGITITDIRPGFVATPMTEKNKGMFWVAPVEKAARQMYSAIKGKRNVVFVTKRWRYVAALLGSIPAWIYNRM